MIQETIGTKTYTLMKMDYINLYDKVSKVFIGHSIMLVFDIYNSDQDTHYDYAFLVSKEMTNDFMASIKDGFGNLVIQRLIQENA